MTPPAPEPGVAAGMPLRPIRTLLIANRGEIARRIARTARSMGIATVAAVSDADARSPLVGEVDAVVRLPGVHAGDTYLRADLLVGAAREAGADAVHPGYGFLSERGDFARAVLAAGLVWVGPPPAAIDAMGEKISAKVRMAAAGVPVLPSVAMAGQGDVELAEAVAREVGFPVLVKASSGGGGRGMRRVDTAAELAAAVAAASREAAAAFADPSVFCERLLVDPRHIEVQIIADQHGGVVSLFERECSIQRRHQKVIEECPSPAVGPVLREAMSTAAVAAAQAVGYVGVGTVEFVVDRDGRFAFLEMNTRLQVEHPVTELVTGLDLVRLQLLVAQGHPLPAQVQAAGLRGHAVEARLYAEDPARDYLPSTGGLAVWDLPPGDGIRVDSGVEAGDDVTPFYDPMLAKIIAWAPTRGEAAARLAGALRRSRVHGVVTNRELLIGVLEHPEFLAGGTDTGFLSRHVPAELARLARGANLVAVHAAAAGVGIEWLAWATSNVLRSVPPGWRNVRSQPQRTRLCDPSTGSVLLVEHQLDHGAVVLRVADQPLGDARLHGVQRLGSHDAVVDLEVAGVRRRVRVFHQGRLVGVDSALGSTTWELVERLPEPVPATRPGSLSAPMPGTVTRVWVAVGEEVRAQQLLMSLEAMKMEHALLSPADGVVAQLRVSAGEQVSAGDLLAVVSTGEAGGDPGQPATG